MFFICMKGGREWLYFGNQKQKSKFCLFFIALLTKEVVIAIYNQVA